MPDPVPPPVLLHGPRVALVVLAAGDGRRSGHDTNKVLLPLAGRRVFTWSIRWGRELGHVTHTVLVIRPQDRTTVDQALDREIDDPPILVVEGGQSRHGSEWAALQVLAPAIARDEIDIVVIHDAARPLAGTRLFAEVVATALREGGAVPVLEQHGLTSLDAAAPAGTGPDERAVSVQTPQAFLAAPLLAAYRQADRDGFVGTDTASCMERYQDPTLGWAVGCVPGDAGNIKITYPEDLFVAERLLAHAGWDLSDDSAPALLREAVHEQAPVPHRPGMLRRRSHR